MRLIDADILENMGYELQRTYRQDANTMVYEVKKIADVPTIEIEPNSCEYWDSESHFCALHRPQVEPVRHGRWIKEPNCWYRCAVCGDHYPSIADNMKYNYCPTCGTRMVGKK